jgi:hypothetical protein
MTKLYSYILRIDDGAAPNPFWNVCTLTICKPAIRRTAKIGDWIIGTGSKNSKCNDGNIYDLSDSLVYAMKVSNKMTLADYDNYCKQKLPNKIPSWFNKDWRRRMGDCIYNFSTEEPTIRKSVHNETNRKTDLSGLNTLLSNCFYYFGEEARPIPQQLKQIIKQNQGHKVIEQKELVENFENWIREFKVNKLYAHPQLRHEFDRAPTEEQISKCAVKYLADDDNEAEETLY